MESRFVEIFSSATKNVIEMMASLAVVPEATYEKATNAAFGVVTGVIGLAGESTSGTLIISFDEPTVLLILSNMLGESVTEITDDVLDAVGEISNMICGDAKRQLSEHNLIINMATPLVIAGKNVKMRDRITRKTTVIPFSTQAGKFVVESNFGLLK